MTIPDSYYPMLARIESSNNPNAKAATSSGSGLYQFLRTTWASLGGKWGNKPNKPFGGLMPTADEQLQRIRVLTQNNAAYLTRQGIPINNATLYAAHLLGSYTASLLLKSPLTKRADLIAGVEATNSNPTIFRDKTVADFFQWLKVKTGVYPE